MDLDKRYPSVAVMEAGARKRLPRFAHDFFTGGIGPEVGLRRNREVLDGVKLMPRYLRDANAVDTSHTLFGVRYDVPFGVAPIGLGGIIWPRAAEILAAAAKRHNMPFALSSFASADLEEIAAIAGSHAWFQLYVPVDPEMERSLLDRAKQAGYPVLVITIDVPTGTRRERDLRNGLSVPLRFDLGTLWQIATHPAWALASLSAGVPRLEVIKRYLPDGGRGPITRAVQSKLTVGHVTPERLKAIRDSWPGKLVVKGVLSAEDAERCKTIGVDGMLVSNHGGRQLDAAPAPVEVLSEIKRAAGPDIAILADGGLRSGLDAARLLASGADFVLGGRAFMFAVAALGEKGGDHVMTVLKEELRSSMSQLGCTAVDQLPSALMRPIDLGQN